MVASTKNLLAIIGASGLVLAGCTSAPQSAAPAGDSMAQENSQTPEAPDSTDAMVKDGTQNDIAMDQGEIRTIEVEAGSFYYKPDVIRVKKGETVKIVMNSVDMMHDFNIDELGVKLPVTKSGETNEVEFTAETVGQFEYYCSVGNHRAQGQIGTLIVEE